MEDICSAVDGNSVDLLDVVANSHKGEITNSAFFDESALGGSLGDFDGGWCDGDVNQLPSFGRNAGG